MIRFFSSYLLSPLVNICFQAFQYAFQTILFLAVVGTLAFRWGYMHRYIWYIAEKEISKALNGACVTIGSIKVDMLRGKCWITDLIVHSPQRENWKWQSPLLCRIGKLYVETNLLFIIFTSIFLGEEYPLEIDTLHVSDIQAVRTTLFLLAPIQLSRWTVNHQQSRIHCLTRISSMHTVSGTKATHIQFSFARSTQHFTRP